MIVLSNNDADFVLCILREHLENLYESIQMAKDMTIQTVKDTVPDCDMQAEMEKIEKSTNECIYKHTNPIIKAIELLTIGSGKVEEK